jgi:LuxR family quorum sensing-dependent transcriptional regulator
MGVAGTIAGEAKLIGVFDTIERAYAAHDGAELDAIMAKAFAAFGVKWFSVDQMRDATGAMVGIHHFGRWPEDWGMHYLDEQHYLHDRVVRHAIMNPTPLDWMEAQKRGALEADEKRLFGEASEFGLKDGHVTPIHQRDGAIASVSMTSDQRLELSPTDRASLRLLSIYYCSFGLKLKHCSPRRLGVALTARQCECLQWVRAGKSSWEIGEIVGIAERTVNFHIEEACKRLNVQTRQQAVIEAVIQGLIAL